VRADPGRDLRDRVGAPAGARDLSTPGAAPLPQSRRQRQADDRAAAGAAEQLEPLQQLPLRGQLDAARRGGELPESR